MLSSFSWALGSVLSHKVSLPRSPFRAAAMEMLAGGVLLLALGLLSGESRGFHFAAVAIRSLFGLAYLIAAGSLLGFTAYFWLLRTIDPPSFAIKPFPAKAATKVALPEVACQLQYTVPLPISKDTAVPPTVPKATPFSPSTSVLLASATIIAGVALIITYKPGPATLSPGTEDLLVAEDPK
jgi:hypothetical protein